MRYFKNKKNNQHLFIESTPVWFESILIKLKNNKMETEMGYSEKDNQKEVAKKLANFIAKYEGKGFEELEISKETIDLTDDFCKKIEIGKVYYFHLEDKRPLMKQKMAAVKLTGNPVKEEAYRVCISLIDDEDDAFSTVDDYLTLGSLPLECEKVDDFEIISTLKDTLWRLFTLGFKRIEEKEILEKIAEKTLDFEQEYDTDIFVKDHNFDFSNTYAKANYFENDLLLITTEYTVQDEKIIAIKKSFTLFQSLEEFKPAKKSIELYYEENLKRVMPESDFLEKYVLAIEPVSYFEAPKTTSIVVPELPISTPQGEIDFPIKEFYSNLLDVNRLYFYVNEKGENLLEWKAAFIVVKNLNRAVYLATKVFALKDFNKIYEKTEESEELKYSSDIEDFFNKNAKRYKKANLKPYDTKKIFEILSQKSLSELNNQKSLESFSFQGDYFKYLVDCYENYANVWIGGNDKIHYLQFFPNDKSRATWLEKKRPTESVEFFPKEIKRIDDFLQHLKIQEEAYSIKNSLLKSNAKLNAKTNDTYNRSKFFKSEFEIMEGDWEVDGDLIIQRNQSLVLKGNLKVSGTLMFTHSTNGSFSNSPYLIIEGSICTQNLIMDGGFEYLQVGGDFKVEKLAVCAYSKGRTDFDIECVAQTDILLHDSKNASSFKSFFEFDKEVSPHSRAILEASIFKLDSYDTIRIEHKIIFDFLAAGEKILTDNIKNTEVDLDAYYQSEFEKYFKDWGYAYYDWAGCEILHLEDSDIREGYIHPESGDWVVHDVRGKSGTFGVSHDDYSMGAVKIKNAKKHGINYREKQLPLLVDAYTLLERYQWVVNLFINWAHRRSVSPFTSWENAAALNADYEKEKTAFVEDPYLALYWLLHFGLTIDERYEKVKQIVIENKLEEELESFKMCFGFFNKTDAFYDLEIKNRNSSQDDFANIFLIRRAYLVWMAHSYHYNGDENALEKWWLSITIFPKVEFSLIQRMRWLKNNLEKFDKWNDFDKLIKEEDLDAYPLLSYVLASNPNTKDKSKYADLFIQELLEHKDTWKGKTPSLFAQTMMWDLKEEFENKTELKKAIDFYFSEETTSEKYEDLVNIYQENNEDFEKIRTKVKELQTLFAKTKSTKSEKAKIAIFEKIEKQLISLKPEDLFLVIENIKDNGLAKRAFHFLYTNEIPEKEIHLTRLFIRIGLKPNDVPQLFYNEFPDLIKNEFDPNLNIVLSWLSLPIEKLQDENHEKELKETACVFLLQVVHYKSVFNNLTSLLNSRKGILSGVIFAELFKPNFKLNINPIDKLDKEQLEVMIEKVLQFVDKYSNEHIQASFDAIRTLFYCDNPLAKDGILKLQKDPKFKAHFKKKKIGTDNLLEKIMFAFENSLAAIDKKTTELSRPTYLEFQDDKSHKFWEIKISDTSFEVRFGRVGAEGKSMTKKYETAIKAKAVADKLIEQKLKKGYKETE